MKRFILTAWILALACLAGTASAQLKYQGEINVSPGVAFLGAGYDATFFSIGSETVHGIRLNPYWFFGAGVGFRDYIYFDGDDGNTYDAMLPVFANARFYFMDRRFSPFLGVDVGYGIGLSRGTPSGLYLSPTVGFNFEVGERYGLYVGLSYQSQDWGKDFYDTRMWIHGIALKLGFAW